jgi:hypothetical protein
VEYAFFDSAVDKIAFKKWRLLVIELGNFFIDMVVEVLQIFFENLELSRSVTNQAGN